MLPVVIFVAAVAAIGVGLVVYGVVAGARQAARAGPSARVTYRTLADVREQLRRRFEPTGAPVWIAANQKANSLAADLASRFRCSSWRSSVLRSLRCTCATGAGTGWHSSKMACRARWSSWRTP